MDKMIASGCCLPDITLSDCLLPALIIALLHAGPSIAANPTLKLTRVTQNVYSAIGETGPPTYDNGGHKKTLNKDKAEGQATEC